MIRAHFERNQFQPECLGEGHTIHQCLLILTWRRLLNSHLFYSVIMATVSNLRKMLSWHLVGYDGFSNSIKYVPQTGVLLPLHYSETKYSFCWHV